MENKLAPSWTSAYLIKLVGGGAYKLETLTGKKYQEFGIQQICDFISIDIMFFL